MFEKMFPAVQREYVVDVSDLWIDRGKRKFENDIEERDFAGEDYNRFWDNGYKMNTFFCIFPLSLKSDLRYTE
ncbi:MAG: hypothetical protein SOZ59_08100 [Candidatus Limivivens sp.]|nr:hypothetical protein [Candidatus Limivivens sp.]